MISYLSFKRQLSMLRVNREIGTSNMFGKMFYVKIGNSKTTADGLNIIKIKRSSKRKKKLKNWFFLQEICFEGNENFFFINIQGN